MVLCSFSELIIEMKVAISLCLCLALALAVEIPTKTVERIIIADVLRGK